MSNPLGAQIAHEVARAESDMQTLRSRGQSVLTVAGGLVSVLAAILALAASQGSAALNPQAKASAGVALACFFVAAVAVALMFRPLSVEAPTVDSLRESVDEHWDNELMDQTVALSDLTHLRGLRSVNGRLANLLLVAILAQVAGLFAVASLAMVLLADA